MVVVLAGVDCDRALIAACRRLEGILRPSCACWITLVRRENREGGSSVDGEFT